MTIQSEFQKSCKVLYNELLSPEIKCLLQDSSYKDKEFILDSLTAYHLGAHLFDGERSLCERFNTGRNIRIKVIKFMEGLCHETSYESFISLSVFSFILNHPFKIFSSF